MASFWRYKFHCQFTTTDFKMAPVLRSLLDSDLDRIRWLCGITIRETQTRFQPSLSSVFLVFIIRSLVPNIIFFAREVFSASKNHNW